MLVVNLHPTFKERMSSLRPEVKKALLETLRKLSESPELEPDRRVTTETGEVCQIDFPDDCQLLYRVGYVQSSPIITSPVRTPVAIFATLQISDP